MKRKCFLILALGVIIYNSALGQLPTSGTVNNYMTAESRINGPSNMEGSPYINDDLLNGYIIFRNDHKLNNILIRYNAYKDFLEMEIKSLSYVSKASDIKEFGYTDPKSKRPIIYKYLPLDDGTSSMIEIIFDEKIVFGIHNRIKVRYGANNGLNPGKDALQRLEVYYLIKDGLSKKITRSNKALVDGLADHTDELNKFIKENKLSAKDDKDITQILKFYNTLVDH